MRRRVWRLCDLSRAPHAAYLLAGTVEQLGERADELIEFCVGVLA